MKKIVVILLIALMLVSLVACSKDATDTKTPTEDIFATDLPEVTIPTVPDNGKVEIEKKYTMQEMMEIKTSWNIEYVFPCDFENVKITKSDDTNLKMALTTDDVTYAEACSFYKQYTIGKQKMNSTNTGESYFISFEEEYVSRTIMIVNNGDNVAITVNYSMDNVNRR